MTRIKTEIYNKARSVFDQLPENVKKEINKKGMKSEFCRKIAESVGVNMYVQWISEGYILSLHEIIEGQISLRTPKWNRILLKTY